MTVAITNIVFNPPGSDVKGEYVTIRNFGTTAVDMTGWQLQDTLVHKQMPHTFLFPRFILGQGATLRVHTGSGINDKDDLYWGRGLAVWNNDIGDMAVLLDSGGNAVSRFAYSKTAELCVTSRPFTNYGKTVDITPSFTCVPKNLIDVVTIILEAERANKHVHAVGSGWSFSDCAVTDDCLVDTRSLNKPIQTVQKALTQAVLAQQDQDPFLFYHVEAGITIKDLYQNLDSFVDPRNGTAKSLALETMGGASGQTLAGAISTGTHGMDKDIPPLADSVVAIHLVGINGNQFWIEPSKGITEPSKIQQFVALGIDAQNIIYDDSTFEAVLVSMGCMGIIYSVVLKVRKQYCLIESTATDTWQSVQSRLASMINDPSIRSLQILLNPYIDSNGSNLCLVTTRREADVVTGMSSCSAHNVVTATALKMGADLMKMGADLIVAAGPRAQSLGLHLLFTHPFGKPPEQVLVDVINLILDKAPDLWTVLINNYGNILQTLWPPGTCGEISYKVMDLEHRRVATSTIGGNSIELFFQAIGENGILPFASFVNALITAVNTSTNTFLAGYVSLRFTGKTRACLGMQQWDRTCSIEVSTPPGIKGLLSLLDVILSVMYQHGGKPHWGQMIDMTVKGHGSIYPRFAEWRRVYERMSNGFTIRTFENDLSNRWQLTSPTVLSPDTVNEPPFLDGTVFLTNDPRDVIKVRVFANAVANDQVEFVLKAGQGIDWAKEIVIKESPAIGPGTWTISVKDHINEARNALYTYQLLGAKLIFRKAQFLGGVGDVGEVDITNIRPGTRVEFTWEKD